MLGEGYSKYNTVVGPQGGTTLKGEALKAEGLAERQELEKEIDLYLDNSMPLGIIIG